MVLAFAGDSTITKFFVMFCFFSKKEVIPPIFGRKISRIKPQKRIFFEFFLLLRYEQFDFTSD